MTRNRRYDFFHLQMNLISKDLLLPPPTGDGEMFCEEAIYPPVAKLTHDDSLTVKSGEIFGLNADGSYDPDGDSISYLWFQYPESIMV